MSRVRVISHGVQRRTQRILGVIGQSIRRRYVPSIPEFAPYEAIVPFELAVRGGGVAGGSQGRKGAGTVGADTVRRDPAICSCQAERP